MKKKIYIYGTVLLLIDQLTKMLIISTSNKIKVLPFLYFDLIYNTGSAFNLFQNKSLYLSILSIMILIYIDYKFIKMAKTKIEFFSYTLLVGGILGNLFDRITRGMVVDFIRFEISNYTFPIFNLADTFIVIGIILLFIYTFTGEKHENSCRQ